MRLAPPRDVSGLAGDSDCRLADWANTGFRVARGRSFPVTFCLPMARHSPQAVSRVNGRNLSKRPLMIEVRNLSKRFHDKKRGEIRAVDGVSFRCEPGRIYGLLGANGAGKTTLLRMLATILEPTSGTATVAGYDVREQALQVRASIGYLSG